MPDGHRSLRILRGSALGFVLIAGFVAWYFLVIATPTRERVPSHTTESNSVDAVAAAKNETVLDAVATPDSRLTLRDPANSVTKPPPITSRGSIHGQVRVALEHAPASLDGFARITAVSSAGQDDPKSTVALPVVRIADDGTFLFPSVPHGEWTVSVEPDACEPAHARVLVSKLVPNAWVEITTFPAKPVELTVILLDGQGGPLAMPFEVVKPRVVGGFKPCFFERFPLLGARLPTDMLRPKLSAVHSDEIGAWVAATFSSARSGYAAVELGGYVVDAVPFSPGQSVVTLRVDDARLAAVHAQFEVRVIDAVTGGPLFSATVRIGPEQPFYRSVPASLRPRTDLDIEAHTDARGVAEFSSAPVGRLDVLVEKDGSAAERRVLELHPGRNQSCEIALARAFTIRGTVEGPDAGRRVLSASRIEGEDSVRLISTSKFDAEGGFTLTGLPAGEYAIGTSFGVSAGVILGLVGPVRAGQLPGYAYVDLRTGDVSGVVIRLVPVEARILDDRSNR